MVTQAHTIRVQAIQDTIPAALIIMDMAATIQGKATIMDMEVIIQATVITMDMAATIQGTATIMDMAAIIQATAIIMANAYFDNSKRNYF